jgi:hypothetical protein
MEKLNMKPLKIALAVALTITLGWMVARMVFVQRPPVPEIVQPIVTTNLPANPAPARKPAGRLAIPAQPSPERFSVRTAQARPGRSNAQTNIQTRAPGASAPAAPDPQPAAPAIPEAVAREALSFVGADAEAEAIWLKAINDPNLSVNARKNLIEDLNEDGFSDPKNPTEDDLPLIWSRIQLIEELAPDAMDQANADAFAEAYKDLVNMHTRLTQR